MKAQRPKLIVTLCAALFIFCGAFAIPSYAVTFNVTNTGDNGGVNPAPNAGTGTLRQAIIDANANAGADTIAFAAGVTGTISLESALPNLADDVTISGPGANVLTVQRDPSASTAFRIFAVNNGKAVGISGLTISGGRANGTAFPGNAGGGIFNEGGTLTMTSSTISGNIAGSLDAAGLGGGIYNAGTLTLNNSRVSANNSAFGGTGGGINNSGVAVTINNSSISGNTTSQDAGGIATSAGTFSVNNSTISGNHTGGGDGGGILTTNGASVNVSNSTISGNSAHVGGGIDGSATVNNSTISGNSAIDGGGVSGGVALNSSIVANNTAAHGPDIESTVSANYSLIENITDGTVSGSNNITGVDPMLGGLQNNGGPTETLAPLPGSPVIDKGKSFTAFTTDQRGTGFPRTIDNPAVANASGGDGTDIGAVESNFLVVNKTADSDDGVCDDTSCTLREAINAANSIGGAPIVLFNIPTSDPGYDMGNDRYTIALGSALANLNSNISINGLGPNRLTVKRDPNAASQFRIFGVNSGKVVTISGLTISGGLTDEFNGGGGIFNVGTLTVSNCTISGNRSAIFGGGGIQNGSGGNLIINNSTVSGNTSHVVAGLDNESSATLTINNSTISGNSGDSVGGIFNRSTLVANNSTITGNTVNPGPTPGPGGIFPNGTETLNSTIVAGNVASCNGMFCTTTAPYPSDIQFGTIDTANYNLIGDASTSGGITNGTNGNIVGNSGSGTIDIHTVLDTNLAFNGGPTQTHALVCGGPAIDNGKNFAGTTTDQRGNGFARTFDDSDVQNASGGDGTDIGAFEVQTSCNRPPTAMNDNYTTDEDTPLNIAAPGVLGNDSDPDSGDTITAVLLSAPSNGTLTFNSDGSFTYTPNGNYNGSDSFTYKARDSHNADSNTATVNITINAVNDPPTFDSVATLSRKQHAGASNSQIATVSDVDNSAGSLVVTVMTPATGISVTHIQNTNGTVTADVAAGCDAAQGSNTVVLKVSDGQKTATANLTVNVTPSDPAVITLKPSLTLSPANHKYHTLNVSDLVASATDDCGGNVINSVHIVSASSDEPEDANGNGDGATKKDIVIANGCGSVQLRAERADAGNGRVYRVNLRYIDSSNNVTNKTATVLVPKSGPAVDNGPGAGYTVVGPCGP